MENYLQKVIHVMVITCSPPPFPPHFGHPNPIALIPHRHKKISLKTVITEEGEGLMKKVDDDSNHYKWSVKGVKVGIGLIQRQI